MRRAHLYNRVRRPGASSTRGIGRVGSVGPADDRTFLEFVTAAVRTVAKRPAQRVNIWSLSAFGAMPYHTSSVSGVCRDYLCEGAKILRSSSSGGLCTCLEGISADCRVRCGICMLS